MVFDKRPKDCLIQEDVDELKAIIINNKSEKFNSISERATPTYKNGGTKSSDYFGWRLNSGSCKDLKEWYIQRWGVKEGSLGGQLAYLNTPLGPHADIIFAIEDHWTKDTKAITQYFLVETDSPTDLCTVLFNQSVKSYADYEGMIHSIENNNLTNLADTSLGNLDYLTHLPDVIKESNLSIDRVVHTPKWQQLIWPSDQIHSGGTFPHGCTYKMHLSVHRPLEEYLEWCK